MAKKRIVFKSKERLSRTDVAQFLGQLAEKIAEGKLILRQGQEEQTIEIPHGLILDLEASEKDTKRKGVKHQLEIEIEWFEDDKYSGKLELG